MDNVTKPNIDLELEPVVLQSKTAPVPNEFGGIYDKRRPKPPKQNFFAARCNKDNFWNIMFWLGMTSGLSMFFSLDKDQWYLGVFVFFGTLFLVPYSVRTFCKVTYTEQKTFINSQGSLLTDRYPTKIVSIFLLALAVCVFTGRKLDSFKDLPDSIAFAILLGNFFLVPTIYFIKINCPISILFNKDAWCPEVAGVVFQHSSSHSFSSHTSPSSLSPSSWSTNPSYRHLGGNMHHR
jgi:hypothetical protein